VKLLLGDCLEVMASLPAMSVDLIVADPPYGINTKSDGSGKLNPWGDMCNAALWYCAWISECRRLLRPEGALWSFLNWRSLVTYQKAAADIRWPIESLLVWDKEWIGPGGSVGLRPSYELVALWPSPRFQIANRGLSDVQRCKWSAVKPNGHPAEKPVPLVRWLISISLRGCGTVLDPFMGSGTTGVAAMELKHQFIGIELDPVYFEAAGARIAAATAQLRLGD